MRCPVCIETSLVMADRSGIEIDYCPQCRGVWLDRGELDKIIERSAAQPSSQSAGVWVNETPQVPQPPIPPAPVAQAPYRSNDHHDYRRDDDDYKKRHRDYDDDDYRYGHKRKKRKSFLDDLFDFD